MNNAMKSPTLICLCLIAVAVVVAAYLMGRDSGRDSAQLATVQDDVSELKTQVHGLQAEKLRSKARWSVIARIGSSIPYLGKLFRCD